MNAVVNDQQSPKEPRKGTFLLLNENFESREVKLDDLKVTGRQIAEAAGYRSTDEVIVLQQLSNGSLEEIRAEELVDLGASGIERFFVMEADSTSRFIVDGLKLEWPRTNISAKTIRKLALKDESFEVIQELTEAPDRILDEEEVVSLKGDGTERFKTKHAAKSVTVYYGETPHELTKGIYTTEQLMAIFAVESGYLLDLIEDGKLIELKPGEKIRVKNGMHFTSHPPRGQSS